MKNGNLLESFLISYDGFIPQPVPLPKLAIALKNLLLASTYNKASISTTIHWNVSVFDPVTPFILETEANVTDLNHVQVWRISGPKLNDVYKIMVSSSFFFESFVFSFFLIFFFLNYWL